MVCSGWLKNYSLCLRLFRSSKGSVASPCNGLGLDIHGPDQEHSLQYRRKSKVATGVDNTASYIPWLYTTSEQMVASNMIHCDLVLLTTTIMQAFCIKLKQCLLIIVKLITHIK